MITNTELWNDYIEKNKDDYGKCCVDVARQVMKILDDEEGDFDQHNIINRADDEIKAGGITGYMAGAVASMVSGCHSRGDEFREKWNKGYGVEDKSQKGVVNPALVTIEVEKDKEKTA